MPRWDLYDDLYTDFSEDVADADTLLLDNTSAGVASDRIVRTTAGNLLRAPLAHRALAYQFQAATELTISGGAVTVTGSYHRVDTEADGATDNLDTISGVTQDGLLIVRSENDARTVVLRHLVGNIHCSGGADISLEGTAMALLVYDSTLSLWIAFAGGGGSAPAATDELQIALIGRAYG